MVQKGGQSQPHILQNEESSSDCKELTKKGYQKYTRSRKAQRRGLADDYLRPSPATVVRQYTTRYLMYVSSMIKVELFFSVEIRKIVESTTKIGAVLNLNKKKTNGRPANLTTTYDMSTMNIWRGPLRDWQLCS